MWYITIPTWDSKKYIVTGKRWRRGTAQNSKPNRTRNTSSPFPPLPINSSCLNAPEMGARAQTIKSPEMHLVPALAEGVGMPCFLLSRLFHLLSFPWPFLLIPSFLSLSQWCCHMAASANRNQSFEGGPSSPLRGTVFPKAGVIPPADAPLQPFLLSQHVEREAKPWANQLHPSGGLLSAPVGKSWL